MGHNEKVHQLKLDNSVKATSTVHYNGTIGN